MNTLPILAQECPHVRICNGCPNMENSYEKQLAIKTQKVKMVLANHLDTIELEPSHALEFYRNRADYWYSPEKQLGFRSKANQYTAFSAPQCQLISIRAQKLYQFLEKRIHELNLSPYSVLKHEGFLRYVSFRESKTTGNVMAVFNTFNTENENEMHTLANEILSQKLADGIVWMHNPHFNDQVQGTIHQSWGKTILEETLNGISFAYDANCFFQTNPRTFEKAHRYVLDLVSEKNSVLDLYCGVGTFSIPLALKGHLVKGIELTKESIIWARKNAHAHGLDDEIISFEVGDVPKKLQDLEKNAEKYDTILLDPPRSGLSKKIWRRVLRLNPKQFIYVACNYQALARDLDWLSEYAEFNIEHARGFDFFPHTEHVETIVDIRIVKIKEFPKGG